MGDHINAMLPAGRELLSQHTIFSGGKRHYELLKPLLPKEHTWIEISGKMQVLVDQYRSEEEPILIFTSGDPFFFGFGNTLKRLMPDAELKITPWFSSIQRLCHKAQINSSEVKHVTLHGRSWKGLDLALLRNESTIGILTDKKHAPNIIAQRLLDTGFENYELIIGEHLDGQKERISKLDLAEVSKQTFEALNVVLLIKTVEKAQAMSFPDDFYQTLEGRPGMITKRPFRALAIQALELSNKSVFWDVGACTASMAIESKRSFPTLEVTAFEIRDECDSIIKENLKKTSTPGIHVEIGDFFEKDIEGGHPDAVFIGGHGNRLEEMIQHIDSKLVPNGKLVMNTVSERSKEIFIKTTKKLGYQLESPLTVNINEFNAINVLAATKQLA
ncbi:MAG: precorrin-6y C5,15-methyltransferase (decarboxylating) subunit CbiE [Crocinitomicaceae bacterium]|nr:precorrin-6y C5,15-methyltransferase (decarboxylating) subunit CbiE [Flavobacteriales bacterium]NQZ36811.1 precorrin-6y C5,15-methyltransferase (decarboxylating) subunit CbiE [Crocinitomicaceae bacterium]